MLESLCVCCSAFLAEVSRNLHLPGAKLWDAHLSFLADLAGLGKETANVTQAAEGEAYEPMKSFILVNDKFINLTYSVHSTNLDLFSLTCPHLSLSPAQEWSHRTATVRWPRWACNPIFLTVKKALGAWTGLFIGKSPVQAGAGSKSVNWSILERLRF